MSERIFRSYRRMTLEEQKNNGLPTELHESVNFSMFAKAKTGKDPYVVVIDRKWEELSEEEKRQVADTSDNHTIKDGK